MTKCKINKIKCNRTNKVYSQKYFCARKQFLVLNSSCRVYENETQNWRMLTNKEIFAILKTPTITETIRLHRLRWFGHVQRMEQNRIPQTALYINLETIRPRGRPRNRCQDEVREEGRIVGGEESEEKVYDREEWKKLLRTARNRRILHMPMK
jgi:hypothetical protein